jgi:branched-chain amino acid transport system substrate-binding protein
MFSKQMATRALAAVLVAAAASSAAAQDTIKIGMVMPLTGALAGAGQQVVAGARFYMRQHGDTMAGRKIELIVKDDGTVPDVGRRLTQELIVNDKVDIIAGGLTADLMASATLITEAKKPTVIMLASTTALIDKSPYFVRTSTTMAQSSAMMADWAVRNGMTRVVTLVSEFAPGVESETLFRARYQAAGGQIAEAIRVPLQSPDFAPALQRARDAAPQAIFLFVPSVQAGTLARQFAERGMDRSGIKLIGPGDITDDDLLPKIGDAMLGTITAHFYSAAHPSAMNKAFVEAFAKQHGSLPNFMVVSGYDGMQLIYAALRKTDGATGSEALMAAMKGMAWESPRGPMSIDPATGEVVQNVYIRSVDKVNGELANVEFSTFQAVGPKLVAR